MSLFSYVCVFGRTPDLAFLELTQFFPNAQRLLPDVARVETDPHGAEKLHTSLGGTVKIAREIGHVETIVPEQIIPFIPQKASLHIGISGYGIQIPASLAPTMKKIFDASGVKLRYATVKHGSSLSSVTVDKSGLTELLIVKDTNGYIVGQTVSVQDYETWNKRDYGRPYADPQSGMLPPKVARMIVNIAGSGGTLLDPFCGMGTILAEAYLSGWNVYGSDQSSEAVKKAKANLDWVGAQSTLYVSDATHVSKLVAPRSIDAIVTEPFMGNARFQQSDIKNLIKGLEKLYIGCLREWSRILVPGGKVVIALPEYSLGGRVYFVGKVIDMCENLGYTTQVGPIEYSRPHATVRRKFFVFQKK